LFPWRIPLPLPFRCAIPFCIALGHLQRSEGVPVIHYPLNYCVQIGGVELVWGQARDLVNELINPFLVGHVSAQTTKNTSGPATTASGKMR
jgi:hypothetical protein